PVAPGDIELPPVTPEGTELEPLAPCGGVAPGGGGAAPPVSVAPWTPVAELPVTGAPLPTAGSLDGSAPPLPVAPVGPVAAVASLGLGLCARLLLWFAFTFSSSAAGAPASDAPPEVCFGERTIDWASGAAAAF